jgi:hypothetical protein
MSDEARCLWCNRPGDLVELPGRVVSPGEARVLAHREHADRLDHFLNASDAAARRMLSRLAVVLAASIIALPVAMAIGVAARNTVAAVAIMLIGLFALRDPLAPPPAVRRFGALRAQRFGRGIGMATVAIGALLLIAVLGM